MPEGLTLKILLQDQGGPALLVDPEQPLLAIAEETLAQVFETTPITRYHGASIPILAELTNASGATPLLAGFSLETDHLHGINESFGLDRMEQGFVYTALLLQKLSSQAR